MVELAFSLLFLLILINGIVDIGALLYSYVALRDSAQEGIIYGTYNPNDTTAIKNRIRDSADFPLNSSLIQNGDIAINCCLHTTTGECTTACSPTNVTSCPGEKFTVVINYTYHMTLPFLNTFFGTTDIPMRVDSTGTIIESPTTIAAIGASCP